jgi:hypothetical protein
MYSNTENTLLSEIIANTFLIELLYYLTLEISLTYVVISYSYLYLDYSIPVYYSR